MKVPEWLAEEVFDHFCWANGIEGKDGKPFKPFRRRNNVEADVAAHVAGVKVPEWGKPGMIRLPHNRRYLIEVYTDPEGHRGIGFLIPYSTPENHWFWSELRLNLVLPEPVGALQEVAFQHRCWKFEEFRKYAAIAHQLVQLPSVVEVCRMADGAFDWEDERQKEAGKKPYRRW